MGQLLHVGKKNDEQPAESTPTDMSSASTCLAHLLLCGSSAWALKYTTTETPLALGAFSYLLGYSVLATYKYGNPDVPENLNKVSDILGSLAEIAPFTLIASQLYVLESVSPKLAYLPIASAVLTLFPEALGDDKEPTNDILFDVVLAANLVGLMYYNYDVDSTWTWGLIALTTLNEFVFRRMADNFQVQKIDVVVIGLTFFCVFACNSVCEAKM